VLLYIQITISVHWKC